MISLARMKVVLISSRIDIVMFCRHLLETSSNFTISSRTNVRFKSDAFYIIDAREFQNASADFLESVKRNEKRILVLLTSEASSSVKNYSENLCSNTLFYPINEILFNQCLKRMIDSCPIADNENSKIKYECTCDNLFGLFEGKSELIRELRAKIENAAKLDTPVLLLGETGTGKSTAAEIIHKLSARSGKPFKRLNVSTISDSLACSTLFGTVYGAYTDAVKNEGMFKAADGGVLFLDEVGMATLSLQAMLLMAIDSGLIQKVGSEKTEKVDVRVILATNASVQTMMREGTFRSDLFFRVSDTIIQMPALRDRKEDLAFLAQKLAARSDRLFTDEAIRSIEKYEWPGNIREFNQCLNRAIRECPLKEISSDYLDFGLFNSRDFD